MTHYFSHGAWLEEGQLLRNADRLAGIPGILLHGQLDLGGPVDVPWLQMRAWPDATLHVISASGHQGNNEITERMLADARGWPPIRRRALDNMARPKSTRPAL